MKHVRACIVVFVTILIVLSGSFSVVVAAEEPQPQTGEIQERGVIGVTPQTHVVTPAVQAAAALDPNAMLARIVQFEATVAHLQQTLHCMDAWDRYGSGAQVSVLSPPHFPGMTSMVWKGYRCP